MRSVPFSRALPPLGTILRLGVLVIGLGILGGCATFAPPPRVAKEPTAVPPQPFATRHPVALVLSGGAMRGFAHIGVIKVLEENGIRPDLVVGSSAGSIVGALYASGLTAAELESALGEMRTSVFRDLVLPGLGFLPGEPGFIRGEKLRIFVRDRLRHELIEDFPIRFAAVATELQTGAALAFNAGDASLAVRASSAVPGVIIPAEIGGRYYGDGQIASPLPVEAARSLGAKIVIAVDVIYPPEDALLSSALSIVFQALNISTTRLKDYESRQADLLIEPRIPATDGQFGFSASGGLIEAGERAARAALPRIREVLGTTNRVPSAPAWR